MNMPSLVVLVSTHFRVAPESLAGAIGKQSTVTARLTAMALAEECGLGADMACLLERPPGLARYAVHWLKRRETASAPLKWQMEKLRAARNALDWLTARRARGG